MQSEEGIASRSFRSDNGAAEHFICAEAPAGLAFKDQLRLVEGRYAARRTLQRIQARLKGESAVAEEKVRSMFREHFFDMEGEIKAPAFKPMTETLQQAIRRRQEKHRLLDELPKKDCAACGAPDCTTLAEDILAGQAELGDCVFVKLKDCEARRQ